MIFEPPKNILPKKSSQKILPKNSFKKIPPKKSFKKMPQKSKKNPNNFSKNSQYFENIQFLKSHLEAENPFRLVFPHPHENQSQIMC